MVHKAAVFASVICAFMFAPQQGSAQEREWSWDMTDEDAFLVFGTPNTDDVGVSFWCKMGSGKIKVYVPSYGKTTVSGRIVFMANGTSFDFASQAEKSDDLSHTIFETEVPWDHAMFAELAKADVLAVKFAGHEARYPLVDANLGGLKHVCRKR